MSNVNDKILIIKNSSGTWKMFHIYVTCIEHVTKIAFHSRFECAQTLTFDSFRHRVFVKFSI